MNNIISNTSLQSHTNKNCHIRESFLLQIWQQYGETFCRNSTEVTGKSGINLYFSKQLLLLKNFTSAIHQNARKSNDSQCNTMEALIANVPFKEHIQITKKPSRKDKMLLAPTNLIFIHTYNNNESSSNCLMSLWWMFRIKFLHWHYHYAQTIDLSTSC